MSTVSRPTDQRSASTTARHRLSLSGRGRIFLSVGLISTIAGLVLGVTDLQRVGVLLLVLPIPAWLIVRRSRAAVAVTHAVHPQRIPAGGNVEVRITLNNPNALWTGPLRITESIPGNRPLRFSVSGLRARQQRTVAYPLVGERRGRFTVGPASITASDPFGLVTADSRTTDVAEYIVQPRRQALAPLALPMAWRDGGSHTSHSVGSGGSDDASVRGYRYGDDLRKVHWRSTARTGALMVRQEERPWHGQTLLLVDTRTHAYPVGSNAADEPSDETSDAFEWSLSAAASICAHLAERGRRVSLVNGSGRLAQNETHRMLDLLADTRPAQRTDIQPLVDSLNGLGRDDSVFAIIAAHEERIVSELSARPRLPGSAVALLVKPWTFAEAPERNRLRAEETWHAVATALRATGWRVVAVEGGADLAALWPALLNTTGSAGR